MRGPVFHRTRTGLHDRILGEGLRVEASEFGACQGIYVAVEPWTVIRCDAVTLRVAVRLTNPMRVHEFADLPEAVGLPRHEERPHEVRERLLDRGYDGALTALRSFGLGPPNQFVLVLRNQDARVIVPCIG